MNAMAGSEQYDFLSFYYYFVEFWGLRDFLKVGVIELSSNYSIQYATHFITYNILNYPPLELDLANEKLHTYIRTYKYYIFIYSIYIHIFIDR